MTFRQQAARGWRALAPPIGMLVVLAGCARAGVLPDEGGSRDVTPQDGGPTDDGAAANADAAQDALPPFDASTDASMQGSPDAANADAASPNDAAMLDAGDMDAGADATIPDDAGAEDAADADTDSPCVPGTYVGTFEGEITVAGFIGLSIDGDIEITVMTDSAGDNLSIDDGYIVGEDDDGNPVEAEVQGVMDCTTFELQGGRLVNGLYTREFFNVSVSFEGVVEATYQPGDVPSVTGTWSTDGSFESGEGTFQAVLSQAAP